MERALFATDLEEAVRGLDGEGAWDRLHFGHETCPWRFPAGEVEAARELAAERGIGFTLVTPVILPAALDGFLHLLDRFRPEPVEEIVFNDLGLLHRASTCDLPGARTMGRLLFPLANDPRLASAGAAAWALQADPEPPSALLAMGIGRREIDSPYALALLAGGEERRIGYTLHHPFALVTVTRLCPWTRHPGGWDNLSGCAGPCRGRRSVIAPEGTGPSWRIAGNAWYADNPPLPEPLCAAVTRLVVRPGPLVG